MALTPNAPQQSALLICAGDRLQQRRCDQSAVGKARTRGHAFLLFEYGHLMAIHGQFVSGGDAGDACADDGYAHGPWLQGLKRSGRRRVVAVAIGAGSGGVCASNREVEGEGNKAAILFRLTRTRHKRCNARSVSVAVGLRSAVAA